MGKTPELGPDVLLYLRYRMNYTSTMYIDLTKLTEGELDAFKQMVLDTIELARPIVQHRDKVDQDNYNDGNDSDPRIYRQVPQLIRRPWAVGIDPQSVLQRLEDIPQRAGNDRTPLDPDGVERRPMVKPDTQGGEPQDDAAPTDESEGVRELDGDADSAELQSPDTSEADASSSEWRYGRRGQAGLGS
jgi:hypothetical protein